jgi:hypothetical protein
MGLPYFSNDLAHHKDLDTWTKLVPLALFQYLETAAALNIKIPDIFFGRIPIYLFGHPLQTTLNLPSMYYDCAVS